MSRKPIDDKKARKWAIASVFGGGALAGYAVFALNNRETGREHQLHLPSGGLNFSLGGGGGKPSYTLFETPKPVNFSDFDGIGARITSANLGVFYGYSIVYLTLWQGTAYVNDLLAYIKMTSGAFMLPGGAVGYGVTIVSYDSGNPLGPVPRVMPPKDHFESTHKFVKVTIIPKIPRVQIPSDVLFDFGKHNINPKANKTLLTAADVLNNRTKLPVTIEGHTDSIGKPAFNQNLGLKRAEAIKRWLVSKKVYKANEFRVISYGEKKPIAPNILPGGKDNPTGRAKNRRVEFVLNGAVPSL